jgi:hypothetical protein
MAYVGYCAGSVTFDELLEAHGSEGVFRRVRPPGFETCDLGDLAGILFQGILSSDAQNSGRQHLESLGRFLALTNTPWFTNIETTATETTAIVKSLVRARGIETLEGDLLFGAFAILAGLVESAVDLQLRDEIAVDMQDAKSASVMSLAPFVRARLRYAGLPGENLNPSVSESQLAIVRDWANGKLSVVSSRQRPPISAPTRAVVGGRRGRLGGDGGATVAPTRRNPRPRKAAPS